MKTKKIKDIENQRFSGSVRNLRFQTDFHGFESKAFKQLKFFSRFTIKILTIFKVPYQEQSEI